MMMPENIGDLVRQRRKSLGLSIESLAEKSGTSVAFISRLELHTKGSVSLKLVFKVLNALGLDSAEVFGQPSMSAEETELWTVLHGMPGKERQEKVRAILKLLK